MWEERQQDKNCGFAPCHRRKVATTSRDGDNDDATNCEIGRRPLEGVISGQMIATGPGIRVTLAWDQSHYLR